MAKVCVGCGLKTDTDGNLIVDTNEATWPSPSGTGTLAYDATLCPDSSGTPIYCTADGSLHGPAEKFSMFDRVGKNFIVNSPTRLTSFVDQEAGLQNISNAAPVGNPGATSTVKNTANSADHSPLSFTIKNPSKCLPFNVYMEAGISHAYLRWEVNGNLNGNPVGTCGGAFLVELSCYVTATGATESFSGHTGHQIWGGEDQGTAVAGISFDTMGARATVDPPSGATKFVIPAGGSMVVKAYPFISLDVSGCTSAIDIQNYTIDVNWWGSTDA